MRAANDGGSHGKDDLAMTTTLAHKSKRPLGLVLASRYRSVVDLLPLWPITASNEVRTTRNALNAEPLVTKIKIVFNPSHVRDPQLRIKDRFIALG